MLKNKSLGFFRIPKLTQTDLEEIKRITAIDFSKISKKRIKRSNTRIMPRESKSSSMLEDHDLISIVKQTTSLAKVRRGSMYDKNFSAPRRKLSDTKQQSECRIDDVSSDLSDEHDPKHWFKIDKSVSRKYITFMA